jgi:diguanylate cyclase (GGDEF)-like protein
MLLRARHSKTPVAALFIDLDNFKSINDTLGHNVGDELLQAVAARLDGVVRDVDALGRLGGDEFVVVAGEMSLLAGPELVAERLLDALKEPVKLGEDQTPVTVTASIGIATGDRATAGDLLRDADIAMYRAKWGGRNRFVLFECGMADAVQSRMELEMDLRVALENDEFFLAFQPTFNLSDMSPTGLEALIRWNSPTRGVVQPDDFIPLLEETGLITDMGRWVLEQACAQAAAWRQDGYPIGIAVNVSARQLDGDRIVDDVEHALAASALDPGALTLEITETTLMRDAKETVRRLTTIKSLGVRIAIDDFGTGYSSLGHLRQFPVDALKIDRSFITGLAHNLEGESLIHTLVQLGKALSIETIAEGIEQPTSSRCCARSTATAGRDSSSQDRSTLPARRHFLQAGPRRPLQPRPRVSLDRRRARGDSERRRRVRFRRSMTRVIRSRRQHHPYRCAKVPACDRQLTRPLARCHPRPLELASKGWAPRLANTAAAPGWSRPKGTAGVCSSAPERVETLEQTQEPSLPTCACPCEPCPPSWAWPSSSPWVWRSR